MTTDETIVAYLTIHGDELLDVAERHDWSLEALFYSIPQSAEAKAQSETETAKKDTP